MTVGRVIVLVVVRVRRRGWVWVYYVDLKAHLRSERGLGRAMLHEFCGRRGRRLLGRLERTLLWIECWMVFRSTRDVMAANLEH
jgi:hypothetical protein